MYGPTGKELGCFLALVAIVGGLVCVGIEHGVSCLWHHVTVGWRWRPLEQSADAGVAQVLASRGD